MKRLVYVGSQEELKKKLFVKGNTDLYVGSYQKGIGNGIVILVRTDGEIALECNHLYTAMADVVLKYLPKNLLEYEICGEEDDVDEKEEKEHWGND